MLTTLEGTERILVTRRTVPEGQADVFEAIPPELKATISEVHFADGSNPDALGQQGTYGIDADEELLARIEGTRGFARPSNLVDVVRLNRYALGASDRESGDVPDAAPLVERHPSLRPGDVLEGTPPEELPRVVALPDGAEARTSWFWYLAKTRLDQGREGACVGFSCTNLLNTAPVMSELSNDYALALYRRAQQIDEWPGTAYTGTSVTAGMKVLRELGLIQSFAFATDEETARRWILYEGPLVWSMDWFEGMYRPNAQGFIRPTGRKVGRHAIEERGRSVWNSTRFLNSWGADWGYRGLAWLSEADRLWYWRNDPNFRAACARQTGKAA
jgi:hypothetical protein